MRPSADGPATFRLGIIGGCLSHQRGTPLNALYHRHLAAMLQASHGIDLRPVVVRHFGQTPVERLAMLADGRVDGVLIHIRPAGLVGSVPVVRTVWDARGARTALNPELVPWRRHRPQEPSAEEADADAYGADPERQDQAPRGRSIARFRLRNTNIALGVLLGLGRRALAERLRELDAFDRAVRARELPYFVLGPTPATYSWWSQRLVRAANDALRARLDARRASYALIEGTRDDAGAPLTRADGSHVSLAGHRYVAQRLHEAGIGDWMAATLKATTRG